MFMVNEFVSTPIKRLEAALRELAVESMDRDKVRGFVAAAIADLKQHEPEQEAGKDEDQ